FHVTVIARAPTPVNTSGTSAGAMSESRLLTLARADHDLAPVARFTHDFVVGPAGAGLTDPTGMARGRAEGGRAARAEPGEDDVGDGGARDADHGTGRGGRLGLRVLQPLQGVLDEVLDVGPGEVDGGGQLVGGVLGLE